jgi:site-specific DNA-methyltransferase (adenine-specific)
MSIHDTRTGRLVIGDALAELECLAADSIDAVVTDPPYSLDFMGQSWDHPTMLGQIATGKERRGAYAGAARSGGVPHAYGGTHSRGHADTDVREFQTWSKAVGERLLSVMKPGSVLLAFGSPRTWHRLAAGLEDAGLILDEPLAWIHGQGMPHGQNIAKALDKMTEPEAAKRWAGWNTQLRPAFEPIVVARKPGPAAHLPLDDLQERFFYCAKAPKSERPVGPEGKVHPTVKPLALMRTLITLSAQRGGTVLDPFLGSGTTAEAASLEGRQWVGIEREETYVPLIEQRLERVTGERRAA